MLNSVVLTGKTPGAWSGLVPELRLDRLAVSAVAPEIGSPTYKSLEFRGSIPMGEAKGKTRGRNRPSKRLLPFSALH